MISESEEFKKLFQHWQFMSSISIDPIAIAVKHNDKVHNFIFVANQAYSLKLFYYLALCRRFGMEAKPSEELLQEIEYFKLSTIDQLMAKINYVLGHSRSEIDYIQMVEQYSRKANLHPVVIE
jgi:hypothetical protein